MPNSKKAFTLIELLVVIAIISLLTSVVLASLNNVRDDARYSKAEQEMIQIRDLIIQAQGNEGADLREITGSNCTYCSGPASEAGITRFRTSLENIYKEAGQSTSTIEGLMFDPWGTVYHLDENEGEFPSNPCRRDILKTYGPNKSSGGGDDLSVDIPFSSTCL